jgi:hypothetical protein
MMKQAQAEANWIWDPKRGDLFPPEWPKGRRPRLTAENIRAQRKLARPGTLHHFMAAEHNRKICQRFNSRVDATTVIGSQNGQKANLGCQHIGNVNCLQCRKWYFSR